MKNAIYFRPEAEKDIEEAAIWYEKQRKGLGEEFIGEIERALEVMSDNPDMYAVVHRNTRRALIRRFPFAIYYRLEKDALVVVAIMHGSRDPKRWQKRT